MKTYATYRLKKLAYYHFMNDGRRHEIAGSEKKNFLTHDKNNNAELHVCVGSSCPTSLTV